jgi:hypothetical protein
VVRRRATGRVNAGHLRDSRARTGLSFAAILAIVTALAVAVFGTGSAAAVLVPVNSFGSEGTGAGQFTLPGGLAIEPGSGNVVVADTANNRIDEFDTEGFFIRTWGWGVKDGTSTLQVCQAEEGPSGEEIPAECFAGLPGQGAGQLDEPVAVAAAPNGDVYVLNRGRGDGRVEQFSTSGEPTYVGSFGGYGAGAGQFTFPLPAASAIAVGNQGEVFVADTAAGRVAAFNEDGTFREALTPSGGAKAVATDSTTGDLFVVGQPGVEVFAGDGTPIASFAGENFQMVGAAVDTTNHRVAIESTTGGEASTKYFLEEFEETEAGGNVEFVKVGSTQLTDIGKPTFYEDPFAYGLAYDPTATYANSTAGAFFLADRRGSTIRAFATPEPGAPEAGAVAASAVGSDGANLTARINPRGSDTHYYFRYGTTTAYGATAPAPPGADIGAGYLEQQVSTHLTGLTPGTTYHFQLVVESALGTVESGDFVFATVGAGSPQVLPDGRVWEQVSTEKGNNDIGREGANFPVEGFAEPSGDGVTFTAVNGLPDSVSGILFTAYGAHRGTDGWHMEGASPPEENLTSLAFGPVILVSPDLEHSIATSKRDLTGTAPGGFASLYLRDNATNTEELMTPYPPQEGGKFPSYSIRGTSTDFRHVFFESSTALTPDSPIGASSNLYEFSGGTLKNVGILPGQTAPNPTGVETANGSRAAFPVSADGSRVFFVASKPPRVEKDAEGNVIGEEFFNPQLFMRTNDSSTIEISGSQRTPAEANPGPVSFVGAAADGSSVFFTSSSLLTDDAYTGTPSGQAPNLYRYELATGKLTDLSVATAAADKQFGANVLGVAISRDGDSAYFTSTADLAPGGTSGETNLYHWTLGQPLRFVTVLNEGDPLANESQAPQAVSKMTPDGGVIAFGSNRALDPAHPDVEGTNEIYRYEAASGALACVSCGQLGSTPSQATIPVPFYAAAAGGNLLSSDGSRFFFETNAALVPQDNNGKTDVYEWEGGRLQLISSGSGRYASRLIDADESGDDVYFQTRDQLAPTDTDENIDVYDAKVGGGFTAAPAASPPCEAAACRPPLEAAPPAAQLGSRSFVGPANQKPKKHPKHYKKKHQKKKHHKHHKHGKKKHHKKHSTGKRG